MIQSLISVFRNVTAAKRLAVCASAAMGIIALSSNPAQAETLPNISATCFTYTVGHVTQTPQGTLIKDFHAELTGTQHRIIVLSSTIIDHKQALNPAALMRINAAAAYGALTAYHRGMTETCSTQPLPELQEIRNSLPEISWKSITLTRPDRLSSAAAAHIKIHSTTPNIHLRFEATGLHSAGALLLPPAVSGDMTFEPAPQPPYKVTIHKIHTVLNGSDIDGDGHVLAAEGKKNVKGDLHLSISHIGDLIDQVGKIAPAKITAALVIARFMGEQEANHRMGWHIVVENGSIHVNNINVPMPF